MTAAPAPGGWRLASPVTALVLGGVVAGPDGRRASPREPGRQSLHGQRRLRAAAVLGDPRDGWLRGRLAEAGQSARLADPGGRRLLRAERGRQLLRGGRLPAASREPAARLASADHPARLGAWHCLFRPDRPAVSRRPAAVGAVAVGAVAVYRAGPALGRRGPRFYGRGDCGPPHWRRCRREPPGPCTSDRRRRLVGSGPEPLLPGAGRERARLAGRAGDELSQVVGGASPAAEVAADRGGQLAWPACCSRSWTAPRAAGEW